MKSGKSRNPGILFDLDGTLVDTVYQHVSAWSVALRSAGIVIPQWKIHRRVGMSGRSMVQQVLAEQGSRLKVDIGLLEKKHDAGFTKACRDPRVFPGSNELLKFLTGKHIRWAIATTGGKEQTAKLLKKLDVPAGVPVVTGNDVAKTKPSPDVFVLAADQIGVPIEDCIVTGDSVWDMLAAARKRALGVGLLCGGYGREELERSGAFRIYADPEEMLLHIEDLGIER
jgi:phosphoglycolate phosphatase-like HAD superfamily hydrolase